MELYSEYFLNNVTSRFVNKIWVLDNTQNEKEISGLRILPNGCFNIALVIGKGASVKMKNNSYKVFENIYLCSQVTENVNISIKGKTKVIIIQLHAWAFSINSNINFNKFLDSIVESNKPFELFNAQIDYKSYSILEDIILITENHFKNSDINDSTYQIIQGICKKIQSKNGACKLSDIYKNYNYSSKWIQIIFKKVTGLTPKKYAEIIRFRLSVNEISNNKTNKSLTEISYLSGYSDQSHFIKNFQKHSKTIPSKFNPNNFILSKIK